MPSSFTAFKTYSDDQKVLNLTDIFSSHYRHWARSDLRQASSPSPGGTGTAGSQGHPPRRRVFCNSGDSDSVNRDLPRTDFGWHLKIDRSNFNTSTRRTWLYQNIFKTPAKYSVASHSIMTSPSSWTTLQVRDTMATRNTRHSRT